MRVSSKLTEIFMDKFACPELTRAFNREKPKGNSKFCLRSKTHIASVAFGGGLGALARVAICGMFTNQIVAIFVCNVIGTFLLSSTIELRRRIHPDIENMVSVGFCGGLSIFASFSRDSAAFLAADNYLFFFANLMANFVLCVATVFFARKLAAVLRAHRDFLRQERRKFALKLHLRRESLPEKISDIEKRLSEKPEGRKGGK